VPKTNTQEIPVFAHTQDDDYVMASISSKALDEVTEWATIWSRSCDASVAKRAQSFVKSLELLLKALDQRSKKIEADSGGNAYLAGLLSQAEALVAADSKTSRHKKSR
jgi:hypothetical protein